MAVALTTLSDTIFSRMMDQSAYTGPSPRLCTMAVCFSAEAVAGTLKEHNPQSPDTKLFAPCI
eukprot:scaffold1314_cov386-Pavlova_lutheri.AAC.32